MNRLAPTKDTLFFSKKNPGSILTLQVQLQIEEL